MSAARDLLDRIAEIGATVRLDGDRLVVRAGPRPVPGELLQQAKEAKAELLTALANAADWRARYREALAHWGALHPADDAARLAWGELQCRWHKLHGERLPEGQCPGCGEQIAGKEALTLTDGCRVHLDTLDCLIAYGERWRGAATRALLAMGLAPPAGEESEP